MSGEHHSSSSTTGPVLRANLASLEKRVDVLFGALTQRVDALLAALQHRIDSHEGDDRRERARIERELEVEIARVDRRLDEMETMLRAAARQADGAMSAAAAVRHEVDRVPTQPIHVGHPTGPHPSGPHDTIDPRLRLTKAGAAGVGAGLGGAVVAAIYALVEWLLRSQ